MSIDPTTSDSTCPNGCALQNGRLMMRAFGCPLEHELNGAAASEAITKGVTAGSIARDRQDRE